MALCTPILKIGQSGAELLRFNNFLLGRRLPSRVWWRRGCYDSDEAWWRRWCWKVSVKARFQFRRWFIDI